MPADPDQQFARWAAKEAGDVELATDQATPEAREQEDSAETVAKAGDALGEVATPPPFSEPQGGVAEDRLAMGYNCPSTPVAEATMKAKAKVTREVMSALAALTHSAQAAQVTEMAERQHALAH